MDGFLPGDECKICKGKCCREHGCVLAPADFFRQLNQVDFEQIKESEKQKEIFLKYLLQEENLFAIDRTSMPGGLLYFLRMRHKCYNFVGVDAMGECIALSKEGCSLAFEERPTGGRLLQSSPDFHCRQQYTLEKMMEDWTPYSVILGEIFTEYEVRFEADGTFLACDEAYFEWMKKQRDEK